MSKVILITGGNRGIGIAIVQRLLETDPALRVIIGARSKSNGDEAVVALEKDGLKGAVSVQLDITSDESIAGAVAFVEKTYGKLDVLVNNAAIIDGTSGSPREKYTEVLNCNVVSAAMMQDAFLPLLKQSADARIVNVSSGMGSIALRIAEHPFLKAGVAVPYCASKAALNLIGIEFERVHPEVTVYQICPSACKTGMNGFQEGFRDAKEGANVVVILALAEKGKYPGKAFYHTEGDSQEIRSYPW